MVVPPTPSSRFASSAGIPGLSACWLDVKLGLRMLRKQWALSFVGGVAMAVAMTFGASIFELLHALMGTSVPLPDGEQVVMVQPYDVEQRLGRHTPVSDFEQWRAELTTIEDIGAFRTSRRYLMTADGARRLVAVAEMSASGFQLARIPPMLGRPLLDEDESAGAPPVVVIGFDVWQSTFGAGRDVVGQVVELDGESHTVVGVMPEDFGFPINHQYWTVLGASDDPVRVFGRLTLGAEYVTAQAEIEAIGIAQPDIVSASGQPLRPRVVPFVRGILEDPGSVVALVPFVLPLLLIPPCANIAILIYARTLARQGEFAARTALGASRGRIIGQIYLEVLVVAAAAAGLALVMTPVLVDFLRGNLVSGGLPFWMDLSLSYTTIGYTAGLACVAALIAGGIPALRATGRRNLAGLQALSHRTAPRLGFVWTTLVLLQVALSVAVVPTGTEIAWALSGPAIDGPRFPAEEYLTATLALSPQAVPDPVRFATLREDLVERLEAEPDVTRVTVAQTLPSQETHVQVEIESPHEIVTAAFNRVDLQFFETFETPLLAGRGFEARDLEPTSHTILVNRSFARRVLGEANPLGRRLRIVEATMAERRVFEPWLEIVGVVEDYADTSGVRTFFRLLPRVPDSAPVANGRADPDAPPWVMAIHAGPRIPAELPDRLRRTAASLDPHLRVEPIRTMDDVWEAYWLEDVTLASGLGILLLGLVGFSSAGIFTLTAFTVVQRRRELGIRSALGAPSWRLVADIFRRVLAPVSVGLTLGGVCALVLEFYLAPVLFDFRSGGRPIPWILPAAGAAVACGRPPRRARARAARSTDRRARRVTGGLSARRVTGGLSARRVTGGLSDELERLGDTQTDSSQLSLGNRTP